MTGAHRPGGVALVEVCVDDLAGVVAAERAGADRVELCADLCVGGTTPSAGLIATVLTTVQRIGVQLMVRPRGGDFVLDDDDRRVMVADLRAIRALTRGAAVPVGVVLGALQPDGRIDERTLASMVAAAGDLPVTFHKAFDATPDPLEAYEILGRHGVVRVLTSGGAATALNGAAMLAELVRRSNQPGAPVVLAGGSVRAADVAKLRSRTGVREVHFRAQRRNASRLVTDRRIIASTMAALDGKDSTDRTGAAPADVL